MRGPGSFLAFLPLLIAGCAYPEGAGTDGAPDAVNAIAPTLFAWTGHVVISEAERPTHFRPTEDILWPYWQEGILFSIDALPDAMEVGLEWEGSGWFMIMLHSHKHSGGGYVEHVTEMNGTKPHCLRVPTADLTEGTWQVMVHSGGAVDADFTLHIGLQGGEGHILEDERHGHMYQEDPLITGGVDAHDIEPCQFLLPLPSPAST